MENTKKHTEDFVKLEQVTKVYKMGEVEIEALAGVDFSIDKGEFVVIAGASGAGKSTLLHILGTLDTPDEGELLYDSVNIARLSSNKLSEFRNNNIGFVLQNHHLLPEFTA